MTLADVLRRPVMRCERCVVGTRSLTPGIYPCDREEGCGGREQHVAEGVLFCRQRLAKWPEWPVLIEQLIEVWQEPGAGEDALQGGGSGGSGWPGEGVSAGAGER